MEDRFEKLDRLLDGFVEEGGIPGCAACIMQDGKTVYEKYAGFADIESGKPIEKKSMFRQFSTTKLFSYVIFAMLYEEGKFLFSDPVGKYLPEWKSSRVFYRDAEGKLQIKPAEGPITVRQAVNMTCGLPYCMFPEPDSEDPTVAAMSEKLTELLKNGVPVLAEEVRAMSQVPLMNEPGSHWFYGFGSEIMGAMIEKFEDMPLRETFIKRIAEPMGLENVDTFITDANRERVVTHYFKDENGLTAAPADFNNQFDPAVTPAGARPNMLASASDFCEFMQMLASGGTYKGRKYLSAGTVKMLTENQLNAVQLGDFENDYLAGYGYGLGFRTLLTRKYGHNGNLGAFGWTGGSGIWAEADPESNSALIYMHNMFPNDELYYHHRFRAAAYGCLL